MSVNRPTDPKLKEQDINQKLQLFGIFQAFGNGKVPSNKQIDIALNSLLQSQALSHPSPQLSQEGKALIADVREVVQQAKMLLLTKNQGNLLQDFLWQTRNIDGANAGLPGAPVDKGTAKQHGNQVLDGLRTLGTLIISNGQFRKLLSDAQILFRDMAGDVAQKAANKVNPDQDELSRLDEPAPDNTWHDTPSGGDIKSTIKQRKPFSRDDVKEAARNAQGAGQDQSSDDPRDQGRSGLRAAADHLQSKADENVPDEDKDNAQQTKDAAKQKQQQAKNFLKDKLPQERRDQTIFRLKKMITEIQGHDDYQQAIETLLSLAEQYKGHAANLANQSAGTVQHAHSDNSLKTAEYDIKTLIERFANSTSLDDLFDAINNLYRDADRDPKLKGWFRDLDRFIRRCLQEQGYVLRDEATDHYNRLYDQGQYLLRDRYRDHTDRILDEFKFIGEQFDKDPHNRAFADAMQRLFLDLGQDKNGKPTFKPHLVKDLVNVIIPAAFARTQYVPIPRIELSDPMVDAIVENLVIESDNLFPNVLEFGNDNYFRLGRRQNSSMNHNKIMVAASGIQMDLKDVAYYVKKKQGFPSVSDLGVMDIFLGGEGFGFKLAARNAQPKDRTHFVAIDNVTVNIKHLNIKLKKSNHKFLFAIAKPLLLGVMKPVIVKIIEKQIKNYIDKADEYLYGIYQEVQRTAEKAANDPDNAQNIFSQYLQAYQRKVLAQKEKAQNKTAGTKVNVAVTKQDSMFKNISLPGGISTKATEYKELAAKGDKWESPIFSWGSARESTDLPKLTPVQRKSHSTATGQVRGGEHPGSAVHEDRDTSYDSKQAGNTGGNTGSGYGSSGTGYGSPDAGHGTSGTGYGSPAAGYGTSGTGYGGTAMNSTVPTTAGFSSQLDRAFDSSAAGKPTTNGTAPAGGPSFYGNVTAPRA